MWNLVYHQLLMPFVPAPNKTEVIVNTEWAESEILQIYEQSVGALPV